MRRITIEDALLSCRPRWPRRGTWWIIIFSLALKVAGGGAYAASAPALPEEIRQIFEKPLYRNSVWGLHVVDLQTGQVIYDLNSERPFLIGSVRKLFSVGLALEALSPAHTFRTPVHRQGEIDSAGVLAGDLILVASGDLAMGGRTNPDGSFAITNLDHNEANALGNAELTKPDPLAGYDALASRVAAAGIKRITGEVIIDDRLFEPFNFREQFNVRPIFVNDDVVDVIINPTAVGKSASVDWRPKSAVFGVQSTLIRPPARRRPLSSASQPELPSCIGLKPCVGEVTGTLPVELCAAADREVSGHPHFPDRRAIELCAHRAHRSAGPSGGSPWLRMPSGQIRSKGCLRRIRMNKRRVSRSWFHRPIETM